MSSKEWKAMLPLWREYWRIFSEVRGLVSGTDEYKLRYQVEYAKFRKHYDIEYRERQREHANKAVMKRYRADPDPFRATNATRYRDRYHSDPEFREAEREKNRQAMKRRRQDPEFRKRDNERRNKKKVD